MKNRISLRSALVCGASLAALLGAQPALAQDQAAPAESVSPAGDDGAQDPEAADDAGIVVTGSRTITNGANAPTPLTVVSGTELQNSCPGNLVEGLTQLPVFSSSTKAGTAGAASTTLGARVRYCSASRRGTSLSAPTSMATSDAALARSLGPAILAIARAENAGAASAAGS